MSYTLPMLLYYLTAAGAFTLGFLAAAAFLSGRRAQAARDRAWLADEVARFAAKCRRSESDDDYRVAADDLERLKEAASAGESLDR
jgi:MoxR-like ATPase